MSILSWAAKRAALVFLAVFFLHGCGGADTTSIFEDDPTDDPVSDNSASPTPSVEPSASPSPSPSMSPSPSPSVSPSPSPSPTPPPVGTFAQVQAIFNANCAVSGCHDATTQRAGLDLSEGQAYNNIVSQFSGQNSSLFLVNPGQPLVSYLLLKVDGAPTIRFERMPLNEDPLSEDDISLIRTWINAGAMASSGPTQVVSNKTAAGPNELRFELSLNNNLDPASLSEGSVLLYFVSNGAEVLADSSELSVEVGAARLVISYRGRTPTTYDSVVLSVNDPALAAVLDTTGNLLDGDGDGIAGGMYRYVID